MKAHPIHLAIEARWIGLLLVKEAPRRIAAAWSDGNVMSRIVPVLCERLLADSTDASSLREHHGFARSRVRSSIGWATSSLMWQRRRGRR